jgi:hypothetical protein
VSLRYFSFHSLFIAGFVQLAGCTSDVGPVVIEVAPTDPYADNPVSVEDLRMAVLTPAQSGEKSIDKLGGTYTIRWLKDGIPEPGIDGDTVPATLLRSANALSSGVRDPHSSFTGLG